MDSLAKIADILRRIDALGKWPEILYPMWVLKPHGSVFPYFPIVNPSRGDPATKGHVSFLEGWQTFHDYNIWMQDKDAGFLSHPIELPGFNILLKTDGTASAVRQTPGFLVRDTDEKQSELIAAMLWETYGMLMRLEENPKLAFKFLDDGCMLSREQGADGTWSDAPLKVVPPRRKTECVRLSKAALKVAKDLPILKDRVFKVEFGFDMRTFAAGFGGKRMAYRLKCTDSQSQETVFEQVFAVQPPELNIQDLWQNVPDAVLQKLVALAFIPGEIVVPNARLFRLFRPLMGELQFKLSMRRD